MSKKKISKTQVVIGTILFAMFIVGLAMVYNTAQNTYYNIVRTTSYFSDANPYGNTLEIDDSPQYGWQRAEIVIDGFSGTKRVLADSSLCDFGTTYSPNPKLEPILVNTRAIQGLCCQYNGYKDTSIPIDTCFKYEAINPRLNVKVGNSNVWSYDGSNTQFPQTITITNILNSECSESIAEAKRQGGQCSDIPCDCNVLIESESSEDAGTLSMSLGTFINNPVPEPTEEPECTINSDCQQNTCGGFSCVDNKCVANVYENKAPSCEGVEWKAYPDCKWECPVFTACGEGYVVGDKRCNGNMVETCGSSGWSSEQCDSGCNDKFDEISSGEVSLSNLKRAECKEPTPFNYGWILIVVSVSGMIILILYNVVKKKWK